MRRTGFEGQASCAYAPDGVKTAMTAAPNAARILPIGASYIHTQSLRLASGHEALVTRALDSEGRAGFGFSLQLDATEARHMALHALGLWPERPRITPVLAHPWETAWVANEPVPWEFEPGFSRLAWLP